MPVSVKSRRASSLVRRDARGDVLNTAIGPLSTTRSPPKTHLSSVNRAIRDAMVNVMLATTPGCGAFSSTPLPLTGCAEETDLDDDHCEGEGRWSKAALAMNAALPRTTSTCLMWCAIALGAIVRGTPLNQVGGRPIKMTACDSALSAIPI